MALSIEGHTYIEEIEVRLFNVEMANRISHEERTAHDDLRREMVELKEVLRDASPVATQAKQADIDLDELQDAIMGDHSTDAIVSAVYCERIERVMYCGAPMSGIQDIINRYGHKMAA